MTNGKTLRPVKFKGNCGKSGSLSKRLFQFAKGKNGMKCGENVCVLNTH